MKRFVNFIPLCCTFLLLSDTWEPMLQTDEHGKSAISFYTGDVGSRYRIVIEGITPDGYPGTGSTTFDVK